MNQGLNHGQDARYLLTTILETTEDAIFSKSLDGIVLNWNPGAEKLYGYSHDEIVGLPIFTILPENRKEEVLDILEKVRLGEKIQNYETVRKRKDGSLINVMLSISPIKDDHGKILGAATVARDITFIKKKQEQFQLIVEAAPNAMIVTNQLGSIDLVNKAAEHLFGYDRQELLGMKIENLIPSRFRSHHLHLREEFYQSSTARPMGAGRDLYGLKKDGQEIPIEIGLTPIVLSEGPGVLASIIDISQRKIFEAKSAAFTQLLENEVQKRVREIQEQNQINVELLARMNEEKVRAEVAEQKTQQLNAFQKVLLDNAETSIISTTTEGIITSFNKCAERMLGYQADEVIGKVTPEIIHDKDEVVRRAAEISKELNMHIEPSFEVFVAKARKNLRNIFEWTYIRKDGRRINVLLSVTALRDENNQIYGFVGVSTEITALKVIESGFANLSQAVEQSPVTVVITDMQGIIEYVNPAFEKTSGYSRDEVKGQHTRMLKSGHQSLEFYQKLWNTINEGQIWRGAFHNRKKSGELYWESASISPIKDKKGIITHFVAVKEDITERKRQHDELEILTQELKRSNQDLERFAYIASHDLQEPLRMVASYTQLLERRYNEHLDDKGRKYIHFAVDGATRMQQLINDLLAYSRVGNQDKEFVLLDLDVVYQKTIKNLEILIKEKNAEISCDKLPMVWGDEGRLVQLFQNLIANGIKFRGQQDPRIQVRVEEKDKEWLFSISDNGIGLDEKYQDRIFLIFQRLHTRAEYEGTGIGLAVCKKIVEIHGGNIWVKSKPGEGATFYFTILKENNQKNKRKVLDN